MPHTDQPEPSDSSSDSRDTLDGILGAAFGRESVDADVSSGSANVPEMPETIGPFRILKTLGRGGMGLVYLAEDTRLAGRRVAIKVLTGSGAGDGPPRARLLREAEAASKLDHPGICAVYEVGEADGAPYIAMRFVDGEPLSAKVRRSREALASGEHSALLDPPGSSTTGTSQPSELTSSGGSGDRAEVVRVIQLVEKAARALHAAHESHLIHRDVKPANIMVTPDGEPVLLDFGLARMADSDLPSLTRTGQLVGTPAYMAPEQIDSDRGPIDRRTDVYGLGVTLQECLTLMQPFVGATREQLYRNILEEEPRAIRRINARLPRDLEAVVATALEKSPARRYQTALELAEDLRRVREHEPTHARPIRPFERVVRYVRRRPTRAALIALLVVGIPVVAAMAGYIVANLPAIAEKQQKLLRDRIDDRLRVGFNALLERADRAAAYEAFDAVLAIDRGSIEAIGGKAMAYLDTGSPKDALALLRQDPTVLTTAPVLRLLEKETLTSLGREEEAAAIVEEALVTRTALGFFLEGAQLLRGWPTQRDRKVFQRAFHRSQMAVMAAPEPRAFFHSQLAMAAGLLQNPEAARNTASVIEAAWPKNPGAQEWVGIALFHAAPEEALVAFEKALRATPNVRQLRYRRAATLVRLGRNEEALGAFQALITDAPGYAKAWIGMAYTLDELGRDDQAIEAFREATRRAPEWYEAWRRLGRAQISRKDFEAAQAALTKAIELHPDDLEARRLLGSLLVILGDHEGALKTYRAALEIDDTHAPSHRGIGRYYLDKKEYSAATAHLERAIACDPECAPAYADLGVALRAQEKPDLVRAIAMLQKAVALSGANASYFFHLGLAYQKIGDHARAIKAYSRAIELEPGYVKAHHNRGAAYYYSRNYEAAIAGATRVIELEPKHKGAHGLLATALSRRSDHELTAKTYEKAVELAPNNPDFWFGLAQARGRLGETSACLTALQRCAAVATRTWPHCKNLRVALGKTEMRVLKRARNDAIIGFGTLPAAAGEAGALALARDAAVEQFKLLIEGWRQAVQRGGPDARRVTLIIERLFDHAGFGAIPESEAFKKLPESEQGRWLEVWRALRKLE